MNEIKHQLTEVICSVRFNQTQPWDSTYFGIYFELIRKHGYTEKQEQKSVQIVINANPNAIVNQSPSETETRFTFKNPKENRAIILSRNYISFHQLAPYKNWKNLINEIALPGLKEYNKMNLGGNIMQVQALYLNQYNLDISENLNNYLTFLPQFKSPAIEQSITFQSIYDIGSDRQLFLSVNGALNKVIEKKTIFLQCGCFINTINGIDFAELSQLAHDEANSLFNSITSRQS